ncbi:MAG: DUF4249 family protein, partial [Methanothrix sp.]|nr:DUF4249 family protein [Methanothrix sp.]
DGPVSSKLAVYSILNSASSTQFVRVGTTYANPPGPVIDDATVQMFTNGRTIPFRDTVVVGTDGAGNPLPINVYVAYNQPISPGSNYTLQVLTPTGLAATVNTQALLLPSIALKDTKILDRSTTEQITLNTIFRSSGGAYVLHFYLDYYAFVDGGWEFHRSEVPLSRYYDSNGNLIKTYPSLSLVRSLTPAQKTVPILLDTTQYVNTRAEVIRQYPEAPVIWLQGVFVLTQIDDVLYNYYYVNNGPVDKSSIRLDQPDYTNIPGGLGVFGSSVTVTQTYPITR